MLKFLKEYKMTIIFILVIALIIAGLTIWQKKKDDVVNNTNDKSEEEAENSQVELIEPTKYQDIETKPVATIVMKDGKQIKIELYPNIAPTTVENFISLANSGFYDGLTFHRTIPDFIIQGGDPDGNGMGGPGYTIKGEFAVNGYKNELSHEKGVISMARTGYDNDSAGSQFFIMTEENIGLDSNYAAFGKVIEGLDVVDEIKNVEVITRDESSEDLDRPVNPPVMKSIRVETYGVTYNEPDKIVQ